MKTRRTRGAASLDTSGAYPHCIYVMNATIQKWGNSLALRLPKALAEEAKMMEGTQVELLRTTDGLLLKARTRPRYRLAKLVAGISARNRHSETDWGPERGREILG
jgi:antitoxin MazE